jgi:WD40 repeat protein
MSFAAVLDRIEKTQNPYPGLRPFETQESPLFFGRDQQVAELVTRLERSRLVAVVGVSGSGKSSLVRAGLIPALQRTHLGGAGARWRIVVTRPAGAPFLSLATDLQKQELDASDLRRSSQGLVHVARKLDADETLLVVVDQFEELFRYKGLEAVEEDVRQRREAAAGEAAEFVRLLLSATQDLPPVYIVLTMRSDYLGECAEFPGLPEALNECQYLVPRLTRQQRMQAIEGPLGQTKIAPSLVQRILNDAGDEPGRLPILQHVLMRTWSQWRKSDPDHKGMIGQQDYEHPAVGGMERALDLHAEELLKDTPLKIARTIFKRLTAEDQGGKERRNPTPLADLWEACGALTDEDRNKVVAVINRFRQGEATFLTPRDGVLGPETFIDITHESLIREWDRLRGWVVEEGESHKTLLRIHDDAQLYEQGKADLWRDPKLQLALDWWAKEKPNAAWARRYIGCGARDDSAFRATSAFLEKSRKSRQAEQAWRKRRRLIGACGTFIVAVTVIGYFWRETRKAREAEQATRLHSALLAQDPLVSALAVAALGDFAASAQPIRDIQLAATAAIPLTVLGEREPQSPNAALIGAWFESRDKEDKAITVSASGTLQRWPADGQGNPVAFPRSLTGNLAAIAVSRDHQWVAESLDNGNWSITRSDGSQSIDLPSRTAKITALAFSPDSEQILTGYADYSVRIWNRHGTQLQNLGNQTGHTGAISSVQFDKSGERALSASWDGTVIVWDLKTGKSLAVLRGQPAVFAATFSPDGRWVLCGYADSSAQIWRSDGKGTPSRLDGHTKPVTSVAFSPAGTKVVTGSEDLTARIWSVRLDDGSTVGSPTVLRGHAGAVRAVAFSSDSSKIITASDDGTARVWWAESREPRILGQHEKTVQSVAFSPDGKMVVSSSDDQSVRVWNLDGSTEPLVYRAFSYVRSAAFNSDGTKVVAGSEGGFFCIWNLGSRTQVFRQERSGPHSDLSDVLSVGFTPDGTGILTGTRANLARVWSVDPSTPEPLLTIEGHKDWVFHASYSKDHTRIVTASADKTAQIWALDGDAKTLVLKGMPLTLKHKDMDRVLDATFSPDGSSVATASADGRARIWNLNSPQLARRELLHAEDVFSVAFSADGKRLLTASKDATAKIWNIETGEPDLVLSHGLAGVRAAAFRPGDSYVVTGAEDGFVRLWRVGERDLVEFMAKASTACLTPRERVRFLGESADMARSAYEKCEAGHGRVASKAIGTATN